MTGEENITLRPAQPEDEEFLVSVYRSTRAAELEQVPWTEQQKDAFVRMQYRAQKEHYAAEYPEATHEIICADGAPVGRLYLHRTADVLHILDITVLPQQRGAGIGSCLLRRLTEEAAAGTKSVTIFVESFSPSLQFFLKRGFAKAEERGFHLLLKWQPAPSIQR